MYMNATTVITRGGAVTTTLRLKRDALEKYRNLMGLKTDRALAQRMGYDAGNLARVLAGKQTPGPKFIAALVSVFAHADITLDDLFEVVPTEVTAA